MRLFLSQLKVSLVSITPEAEKTILYCARVSNPLNQNSDNTKLIDYCIKNGHWSIFEMADMCIEIHTSRAISAQILRHKSFSFQEFSQRYAAVQTFETYEARRQDNKNRQNSISDMSEEDKQWFRDAQERIHTEARLHYNEALNRGIAKEQARFLLPLSSSTTLYMKGNIRSWLHYLDLRCGNGTQKEHQDIAHAIKKIFMEQLPIISEAKNWKTVKS